MRQKVPGGWQAKVKHRTNVLLVLASLAVGLAGFSGYLLGDHLHVNGIVFDASVYASLVRDFYGQLAAVGAYRIQRILPSAVLYYVFRLCQVTPTDSHIIVGFILLNTLSITLTGYFFSLIAEHLSLSTSRKWLGIICLFINFAILKHQVYSPILTDTVAYAVGMMMLYFYLVRNSIGLLISTVLGAFVWPTMLLQGVILLIGFRRKGFGQSPLVNRGNVKKAAVMVSLLISLFALVFILYLRYTGFKVVLPALDGAFYISLAVVFLYVFWGMKSLLSTGELLNIKYLFSHIANRKFIFTLVLVTLVVGLIKLSQHFLTSPQGFDYPITRHLSVTFWVSILYPGVFYISHVIYFGPVIILLLFLWPKVCRLINQHGVGLSVCAVCSFIMSLDSESRHLTNFMPMFVVFLAKATESLRWGWKQYSLVGVLSLLMSKVWLTIGPLKLKGDVATVLLTNQRLFMSLGPSMSGRMYVVQGLAVLLVGIIIYYTCFKNLGGTNIQGENDDRNKYSDQRPAFPSV